MHDVEAPQHINNRIHPWIRSEAATILFIAIFNALFVHLGFGGISAYYGAMGFPPALFPPSWSSYRSSGLFTVFAR